MAASCEELVNALGENLAMKLSFDDEGVLYLQIASEVTLQIRKVEDEGRICLVAPVCEEWPDNPDPSLVIEIVNLAINPLVNAGPAIGREPNSGVMVAYVSLRLDDVEASEFPEIVSGFLQFAIAYAAKFRGGCSSAKTDVPVGALKI